MVVKVKMQQLLKKIQILVILIFISLLTSNAKQATTYDGKPCGTLDEELLNTSGFFRTAPIEHQWIARVVFNKDQHLNSDKNCLAALITANKLLAPASCFRHHYGVPEAYSVELGIWNISASNDDWACNADGFCVPPVQTYNLSDIALHPDYDSITFNNNIAVLTLDNDVKVSKFIEPICARPKDATTESIVGQYFYMGGFHAESELKSKNPVLTISQEYCIQSNNGLLSVFTSTIFCGLPYNENKYAIGSPLVAVHVEDDEPTAFYLIGFLVETNITSGMRNYASYQDVRPYKYFIERNLS